MPKSILRAFVKQFFFWILFFELGRILFLIYHFQKLKGIPPGEILFGFIKALPLDISMTSYLMIIPWLLLEIQSLYSSKIISQINKIYTSLILILCSLILCSELEVYNQWGTKLSAKALSYLMQPSEMFGSIPTLLFVSLVMLVLFYSHSGYWLYKRYFFEKNFSPGKNILFSIAFFFGIPGLLILGLRGGVQQIPINQSSAYYSRYEVLNAASVNPVWNLLQSIEQNSKMMNRNPFVSMTFPEASAIVDSLQHIEKDTTVMFINRAKPNIVLIILEGFSADNLATLGGYKETAPNLDKIAGEGFLFSELYSSGDRSEQGMAAILSGFPAQPLTSILRLPDKFQKLPSLVRTLSEAGYHSNFCFGGQLSYGNIKAYLIYNGIEKITELDDFSGDLPHGKLGVHDEFLFSRELSELDNMQTPFFSSVFTLSSHTPYDFPKKHCTYAWAGDENEYVNGVMYSDSCLGNFFREAKTHSWYDNTLFVIIADHSHHTSRHRNFFSPGQRKIPLLFYGNVLKPEFKGMKNERIASQIDLASTLLGQLNINSGKFHWSQNLMNPYTRNHAFLAFLDGSTGWIQDSTDYFAYNQRSDTYYENTFTDSTRRNNIIRAHNGYLQMMYKEYLGH